MAIFDLQTYAGHDACGLAQLVRSGQATPGDLVELAVAAHAIVEPELNATVEQFDEATVASFVDAGGHGPLAGVPSFLKDFPARAGILGEMGSTLSRGLRPDRSHNMIERFEQAGLIWLGRTTTSEFGVAATTECRVTGATRNPWDPSRSTAGSSGGSAALCAAGVVPVANASDGGGSIRNPAGFCGLVGLKPSRGRISGAPGDVAPLLGLGIAFAVTRSVRDTACLLDLVHGPVPGDGYIIAPPAESYLSMVDAKPEVKRIAVCHDTWSGIAVDPEVQSALEATALLLADLGYEVLESEIGFDYDEFMTAQLDIWAAHTAKDLAGLSQMFGRPVDDSTVQSTILALYEYGNRLPATRLLSALDTYSGLTRFIGEAFGNFDILLTPTSPMLPPKIGAFDPDKPGATMEIVRTQLDAFESFTSLFNATGQPAISLPLQSTAQNLPIGMQFIAPFGRDHDLISLAAELEKARPWAGRRPMIHAAG